MSISFSTSNNSRVRVSYTRFYAEDIWEEFTEVMDASAIESLACDSSVTIHKVVKVSRR